MRYHFVGLAIIFGIIGLVLVFLYPGNSSMTATGAMCFIIAITMRWLGGEKEAVV